MLPSGLPLDVVLGCRTMDDLAWAFVDHGLDPPHNIPEIFEAAHYSPPLVRYRNLTPSAPIVRRSRSFSPDSLVTPTVLMARSPIPSPRTPPAQRIPVAAGPPRLRRQLPADIGADLPRPAAKRRGRPFPSPPVAAAALPDWFRNPQPSTQTRQRDQLAGALEVANAHLRAQPPLLQMPGMAAMFQPRVLFQEPDEVLPDAQPRHQSPMPPLFQPGQVPAPRPSQHLGRPPTPAEMQRLPYDVQVYIRRLNKFVKDHGGF